MICGEALLNGSSEGMRSNQRCSESFSCDEKYSRTNSVTLRPSEMASASSFASSCFPDCGLALGFPAELFLSGCFFCACFASLRSSCSSSLASVAASPSSASRGPACIAVSYPAGTPASKRPACAAPVAQSPRPSQNQISYRYEPYQKFVTPAPSSQDTHQWSAPGRCSLTPT